MNLGINSQHSLNRKRKRFLLSLHILYLVGELLRIHLNADIERIRIIHSVNFNKIIRRITLLDKNRLDLRRENVYAADNKHIVASAHRLAHLYKGTSIFCG